MASARRLAQEESQRNTPQLPDLVSPEKKQNYNQKDELFNALLEMLASKKIYFPNAEIAHNEGKMIIGVLTNVLWHIDEHHEKINAKSGQCKDMPSIPLTLSSFRGFNFSKKKKHAARLESAVLSQDVQHIYQVLAYPVIQGEHWAEIHGAMKQLAECLHCYSEHLKVENDRQKKRHLAMQPVRTPLKDFDVYESEATTSISSVYLPLDSAVREKGDYDVIHVDSNFSPLDRRRRYEYLHSLQLSIPIQIFRYNRSESLGTMTFLWKIPVDKEQRSIERSLKTVDGIRSSIPVYHTRAMRRDFCARFGLISKTTPLILNEIYRSLTDDASAVPNPEIVDRLRTLLYSDFLTNSSVIVDLRELNTGHPSHFTAFWDLLSQVLQEYNEAAASDRRHGQSQMPVAMSIPDLSRKVQEKIPLTEKEHFNVPSDKWIRLQFLPRSLHSHASYRFVKQFNIRFHVQQRILRSNHEDSHYAATQFRYLREFTVCFRDHCTFLSMDDKHSISVGEPNAAVASLDRGRRVLASTTTDVVDLDHDFTKAKLTPSVSLAIDIPDSITESFYRGKVYVDVRDAVFFSSSALGHSQEAIDIDQLHGVKPILTLFTDGGPDHRTTFLSVQLALIAIFRKLNLDMLVAARTAPGQSFINPVERVMSLLNVALNGVSLERARMDDRYEMVLSRCNSMSEIRSKAKFHKGLKEAFSESMAQSAQLIAGRFSRLHLKDQQFVSKTDTTSTEELKDLFGYVQEIDPKIEVSDMTQKALAKCDRLKRFLETHTIRHHYIFQIKKCALQDCEFGCKPTLLPELFSTLKWLPDPVYCSTSDHYLPYQDVWGTQTTEKDRPSLKQPIGADLQNKVILVSTKACCTVKCCACDKPRVVYSSSQISSNILHYIRGISEDCFYSCGSQIPVVEDTSDTPVVREGINCSSPVEFAYYSSKKFMAVCALCGSDNDCTVNETLKEQFQTVLPLCQSCVTSGKEPITRGMLRKRSVPGKTSTQPKHHKK